MPVTLFRGEILTMFNPNNLFHSLLIIPILNILIAVYKLFLLLRIPGALGFALIFLTVLIRLVLHPLTVTQLKSAHHLSKLKPELDQLSKKYKDDKQKLHQEQLRLYKEAGVNPAAGCLPLLLQMPILIALYNLFFQILGNSQLTAVIEDINRVVYFPLLKIETLNLSFLGLNLASKPSDWRSHGYWLLLVPVVTALLQYWQTKMMTPNTLPASKVSEQAPKKDEKKGEDMGTAMQKQMTIMMPLMIGFFAYSFPLGLSLYWNTFTLFGIIQQHYINKQVD